jgi:hypothetical protein
MKKTQKVFSLIGFIVIIHSVSFGQGPPNPPTDPSVGGAIVGGGAPIDGGSSLLLFMGALWAGRKTYVKRRERRK